MKKEKVELVLLQLSEIYSNSIDIMDSAASGAVRELAEILSQVLRDIQEED
jgi:hypothetical protein